jgi:hypothetical protein
VIAFENPFRASGRWLKGNLHTHTTNSDGALAPPEMAKEYRMRGYDFLCITDHGRVSDVEGLSEGNFLVIDGEELSVGSSSGGEPYHLVAIDLRETVPDGGDDPQVVIDELKGMGSLVLLCHPYWSSLTLDDMLRVDGYVGIEIFNTSCFYSIAKGHSTVHWDDLLSHGRRTWGLAVDDAHWHFNDHRPNDACGAWIMVKARSSSRGDIKGAIDAGLFYSSNGPTIDDLSVEDGDLFVSAGRSKIINFIADSYKGESYTAPPGEFIEGAQYAIRGDEKYVRVECIDEGGHAAWTNPIFLKA